MATTRMRWCRSCGSCRRSTAGCRARRWPQLAAGLGLTLAQVQGVAGFYRFFHTQPVGEYRILFSDNVTDRMLGSQALMADLCRRLGVAPGRVGEDGLVSVDRHLLHRPVRPGPGAAGQPPPGDHPAGCGTRGADGRR